MEQRCYKILIVEGGDWGWNENTEGRRSLYMDHLIDIEEDILVSTSMSGRISKVDSHLQA